MSYQVLARKWRPADFSQMVGQQHVLKALINALENDRLHHAYLFTGTRGVGKTTIARILAKCLNCEAGVTATPCGECASCKAIATGNFVDLIEVDAASRTKVEDTRELLDNVQYAPTRGRFKVYLIDEVHMLTGHSFNALLKTLEEPPPHVKFLFATTDPQKLPVTILSRCLQFNLKRMPIDMISTHLKSVMEKESVQSEESALKLIARAADGSMRDALSLLDQAIAFGGGEVREADVREMLGTISHEPLLALIEAVGANDGALILQLIEEMASLTPDFEAASDALISLLHQLAVQQVVKDAVQDDDNIIHLAKTLSREAVQLYYQIALHGRRDIPLSPDPRSGFEMILLRMLAFRPLQETECQAIESSAEENKGTASSSTSGSASAKKKSVAQTAPNKNENVVDQSIRGSVSDDHNTEETSSSTFGKPRHQGPAARMQDALETEALKELSGTAPKSAVSAKETCKGRQKSVENLLQKATVDQTRGIKTAVTKVFPDVSVENKSVVDQVPWDELSPVENYSASDRHTVASNGRTQDRETNLNHHSAPSARQNNSHDQSTESISKKPSFVADSQGNSPPDTHLTRQHGKYILTAIASDWLDVVPQLKLGGRAAELVKHCLPHAFENGILSVLLDEDRNVLLAETVRAEIENALAEFYSEPLKIVIQATDLSVVTEKSQVETAAQQAARLETEKQSRAKQNIETDPFVLELQKRFGAQLVSGSLKPK